MRTTFWAIAVLLMAVAANGERIAPVTSPDPVLERWRWNVFDASNGLEGRVYDVHEDRDGTLWLATDHGVQQYDGYTWSIATADDGLASADVRAVLQTRDGTVWAASADGSMSRRSADGRWAGSQANSKGEFGQIRLREAPDGDLFAAYWWYTSTTTEQALLRFDGDSWSPVAVPDLGPLGINDLEIGRDGSVWVATATEGENRLGNLLRWRDGHWDRPDIGVGRSAIVRDITVAADGSLWFVASTGDGVAFLHFDGVWHPPLRLIAPDHFGWPVTVWQTRDGTVWGSDHSGRLCRVDQATGHVYTGYELPTGGHLSGVPSRRGSLWLFGAGGTKLYSLNLTGGWAQFNHPDGLHGGFDSADGIVWFRTQAHAVRYANGVWTESGVGEGFPEGRLTGIYQTPDGVIWYVAIHNGSSRVIMRQGDSWQSFDVDDGIVDQIYTVDHPNPASGRPANYRQPILQARDGSVWFVGQHDASAAVCRFDDGAWHRWIVPGAGDDDFVTQIFEAADGSVWAATLGGRLNRFVDPDWQGVDIKPQGGPVVTEIGEWPAGTLWLGTTEGVSLLTLSTFDSGPQWYHKTDFGIQVPKIRSFVPTAQGMWFGFLPNRGGGVGFFDGETWQVFTEADGLADNSVSDILQARDGAMWFVGQGGVSRFDGDTWLNTTREDGLELGWLYPELREAQDGSLWIDDSAGSIVHMRFRADPLGPDTRLDVAPEQVSSVGSVSLRWHGRDGWEDTPRSGLRYQWRLDDGPWSPWSGRMDHGFSGVEPGKHRFEVRTMDRDARIDPTPAVHTFAVEMPWWRDYRVWSLTTVLLALVALQSTRVVRRDRRLSRQAESLATARDAAEAANRAKSQFLANMSHEIRTPMNAVLGYAQILRRSADMPPEHRRAVETIHKGGDHLLTLINDVLDLSKIEAGRMELQQTDFDLHDLLRGLAAMFELQSREKGLDWRLEGLGTGVRPVHGDEAKLRQVLINLLGNAVKFTSSGHVSLALRVASGDHYRFEVEDTGGGMSAADVDAAFQPFQQGEKGPQQGGTGLGLAISLRQVELMGGRLDVDSHPDRGSRFGFTLHLPPAMGRVRTVGNPFDKVIRLAPGQSVRALVADDVADNRDVLADMLRELGLHVDEAADGVRALEQMEQRRPDIVFLDVHMPAMGGPEALRHMRSRPHLRGVRVVAMSASVLEHERKEVLALGFEEFLDKPLRFEQLCAALDRLLGVRLEYESDQATPEATTGWAEARLPVATYERLREAAELYSVTEMNEYCGQLEHLGEPQRRLARHLRELTRRQDMAGILKTLEAVPHA